MTRPRDWEAVGRETLYYVLVSLTAEIEESVEPVADTVYWGGDPDAEQVERLRRLAFEFEYAVEAYVAALAADAEPWGGDGGRPPSLEPPDDARASADGDADAAERDDPDGDPDAAADDAGVDGTADGSSDDAPTDDANDGRT